MLGMQKDKNVESPKIKLLLLVNPTLELEPGRTTPTVEKVTSIKAILKQIRLWCQIFRSYPNMEPSALSLLGRTKELTPKKA